MPRSQTPKTRTNDVLKAAFALARLATIAGRHRREILPLLRRELRVRVLTSSRYSNVLRCAKEEGWVRVDGTGLSARVVDVRPQEYRDRELAEGGT